MTTLALILAFQTLTATVAPNTPFQISWDYPASTGYSFRLWCNNAIVRNFTSADITLGALDPVTNTWIYTANVPGLPAPGAFKCEISAHANDGRPDVKSAPVSVTVVDPTAPIPIPVNVRIIIVVKGGGGE
jgi:hypothetical protein